MTALLEIHDLTARYGDFQALFGVDLALGEGETVAIIGANGAGKTTLMRSISGILKNAPGSIHYDGRAIGDLPADEVLAMGIAMVPEGRKLFPSLSVEENLQIGAYGRQTGGYWSLETVYDLFPCAQGTPQQSRHRAFGRTAADGCHRPRPDEQSAGAAV
jgi:branched-chain amino acid transport system ATP-binding protein